MKPSFTRSALHKALFAVPTKAVAATTGTASGIWTHHRALVLTTGAVLALLAPLLLKLPRKAAVTGAILVLALLQMAFDMPCANRHTALPPLNFGSPNCSGLIRCSLSRQYCSA